MSPARSLNDLLEILGHGPVRRSFAKLEKALAELSAADLADLAAGLKARAERDYAPDNRVRQAAIAVVRRWMQLEPAPAIEFALLYRPGLAGSMEPVFLDAIATVFASDRDAAIRFLGMLGNERELYIYARWRCLKSIEGMGAPEALALIADLDARTGNENYRADYLGEFPKDWVTSEPETAMQWALTLPPGFTRNHILSTMGTAWVKADAAAVRKFIGSVPRSTLPNGNTRNLIMESITKAEAAGDPGTGR